MLAELTTSLEIKTIATRKVMVILWKSIIVLMHVLKKKDLRKLLSTISNKEPRKESRKLR